MKKIIFITAILLLLVSCTVTKQKKSENQSYQQQVENSTQSAELDKTTQTVEPQENKSEISNNTNFSTAQPDKNKLLEKLRLELLPQEKDKNYNPYRYAREEHIITCLEIRISYERENCEKVTKIIEEFHQLDSIASNEEKQGLISDISFFACKESYDFLEEQIKNNSSEAVRYYAIIPLAWSLNTDYLPVILEYAKRESLSIQEKIAIAGAFTIFGIYTSYPELKEEAIKILNEISYDSLYSLPNDIMEGYIWTYYKLGGNSAIRFFDSLFEQDESRKAIAALFLAELGEYDKVFPYFIEIANTGEIGDQILYAMKGLAATGTEEAFQLIKKQTQSKNEAVAKEAQWIFQYIDIKRREQ